MSTLQVTQARVMKSEWTKLRTQPGALWSLLSALILVVAFGILYSLLRVARPPHGAAAASFDPTSVSLAGVQLAQIAAGVLGVLLITSEYATGLIRTTLAAVPRRLPTLWGKAAVVIGAVVAVSVPAAVAVFLAGQAILGRQHLSVSFGAPGVARAVIGGALYLAVAGLLGLALGALLRSAAGGIAALFGLLFAVPILVGFLPGEPGRRDRQVPARHGRPGRDDGAPGPGDVAGAVDRVRRVLRLRGRAAGYRRGADAARGCVALSRLAAASSSGRPAPDPGAGRPGGSAGYGGRAGRPARPPPCRRARRRSRPRWPGRGRSPWSPGFRPGRSARRCAAACPAGRRGRRR